MAPRIPGVHEEMLAQDQDEYLTVCVGLIPYVDGAIGAVTRWRLTDEEKQRIMEGEDLYLNLLTQGGGMQPVRLEVGPVPDDWHIKR